ncbi:unnamed protein product [Calypogeia fissa]
MGRRIEARRLIVEAGDVEEFDWGRGGCNFNEGKRGIGEECRGNGASGGGGSYHARENERWWRLFVDGGENVCSGGQLNMTGTNVRLDSRKKVDRKDDGE